MVEPLSRTVRVPRVDARNDEAQNVRRAGEKEGLDVSETQRLDDCREKVGDGAAGDDTEDQDELGAC